MACQRYEVRSIAVYSESDESSCPYFHVRMSRDDRFDELNMMLEKIRSAQPDSDTSFLYSILLSLRALTQ